MTSTNTKLYFVAVVPDEFVFQKIQKLKEEISDKHGSKAALKSPPHITLHMPFKFREDREDRLMEVLESTGEAHQAFQICHDGFGTFPPKVIFVDVNENQALHTLQTDLVRTMRRTLKLLNADYKNKPFHPHVTIAFRDLKKRQFAVAWDDFGKRNFTENWPCKFLTLLKHNGQSWDIYKQFPLLGKSALDENNTNKL